MADEDMIILAEADANAPHDPTLKPTAQPIPLAPQPRDAVKVNGKTEMLKPQTHPDVTTTDEMPVPRPDADRVPPLVVFPQDDRDSGAASVRGFDTWADRTGAPLTIQAAREATAIEEGAKWWGNRRSLTKEEESKLRMKKPALHCSVMYFPDAPGYVAFTHRARSKVYRTPGEIPVKALKFVSDSA